MKTEILYLVSTGDYSDYNPNAVFTTKELAQAYIDSYGAYGKFNDIEEIELNPVSNVVIKDAYAFSLEIDENFNIGHNIYSSNTYEDKVGQYTYKEVGTLLAQWKPKKVLTMYLLAKDQEHAIKIAKDKAIEIKATVGWGNLID